MTATNSIVIYRNNLQTFCILCISSMQSSFVRNKIAATSNPIESNRFQSNHIKVLGMHNSWQSMFTPPANTTNQILFTCILWIGLKQLLLDHFCLTVCAPLFSLSTLIYVQLVQISACLSNRFNHIYRIRTHLIIIKIYNNYTN